MPKTVLVRVPIFDRHDYCGGGILRLLMGKHILQYCTRTVLVGGGDTVPKNGLERTGTLVYVSVQMHCCRTLNTVNLDDGISTWPNKISQWK